MTHTSDITIIDSKQREWSFKGTGDEDRFSKEMEKIAINLHPIKNKKETKRSSGMNATASMFSNLSRDFVSIVSWMKAA